MTTRPKKNSQLVRAKAQYARENLQTIMVSGFEISDRLKMLGDKQRKDKERIKKLKQKLLKKGRT